MDIQSNNLQEKINRAPKGPGCYLYKDIDGTVIYVGKAKILRNRVRQYFQKSYHGDWEKISRLVKTIADVEFFETGSELDALLHEHRLIKKYRPWFNTQLKSDKRHPYICIDQSGAYAAFYISPSREESCGKRCFGFFYDEDDARNALHVINRAWKLPSCGKTAFSSSGRACLNYHMKACMAPCEGSTDREEYARSVEEAIRFLDGKETGVLRRMQSQMHIHAEVLNFEKAAAYKALLSELERLQRKCKRMYSFPENRDILLFMAAYRNPAFTLFYIGRGKVQMRWDFESDLTEEGILGLLSGRENPNIDESGWLEQALLDVFASKHFAEIKNGETPEEMQKIIEREFLLFR